MVLILDPTHTIRFLFGLFRKTPKKSLDNTGCQPRYPQDRLCAEPKLSSEYDFTSSPRSKRPRRVLRRHKDQLFTSRDNLRETCGSVLIRDDDYYLLGPDDGMCCVLRAGNTLFKVHKIVLCRDDSAFSTKLLWFGREGDLEGTSDANPIVVAEGPDKFRDLLWALHNIPPDFHMSDEGTVHIPEIVCRDLSFSRLLNIAELTQKYSFPSFERWSVEQIFRIVRDGDPYPSSAAEEAPTPSSIASSATLISCGSLKQDSERPLDTFDDSDVTYARLVRIALTNSRLLHLVVYKLISKILWFNHVPKWPLLQVLEQYRDHQPIDTLLGVAYYRLLNDLPRTDPVDSDTPFGATLPPQPIFPSNMDTERRMQFLAAHHSLTETWKRISHTPPEPTSFTSPKKSIPSRLCGKKPSNPHCTCIDTWNRLWRIACNRAERGRNGEPRKSSADVLGLLKSTMLHLRKLSANTPSICLDCAMDGLEAVDFIRDKVIDELIDTFTYIG